MGNREDSRGSASDGQPGAGGGPRSIISDQILVQAPCLVFSGRVGSTRQRMKKFSSLIVAFVIGAVQCKAGMRRGGKLGGRMGVVVVPILSAQGPVPGVQVDNNVDSVGRGRGSSVQV